MDNEYTQRLKNIEAVIEHWLPVNPGPSWIKTVFPELEKKLNSESIRVLLAPEQDLLARGGKHWRPLLMTLVCESLGGGAASLLLAPLVEFCHNASLIHDDIEDNSEQRRGKPAIHRIYGIDTAINSGCFLYFLSLNCIESWAEELVKKGYSAAPEYKNRIYSFWAEYMRKLHLGQAMDISWHRNLSLIPELDEYYLMCGLKTGCLARFAAGLGVYAASAAGIKIPDADKAMVCLGEAAEKLGVGFQILDDVKNLTTGIKGKKRGDDVVEGKKSLPVLMYLHRYPEKQDFVYGCFIAAGASGVDAPEVEDLIYAFTAAGVLDEAKENGLAMIAQAREIFSSEKQEGFSISGEGRVLLAGLTRLIS